MDDIRIPRPSDVLESMWYEVVKKMKNVVLFADENAVESLHWFNLLEKCLKAGVKEVKEFTSFEQCKYCEKAVFLISDAIVGVVADILQNIIKNSNFQYVIIIQAAHANVQSYAMFGEREDVDKDIMAKLEDDILNWMGNKNYTIEIFYYPLLLAPITKDLFLLPKFEELFPLFQNDCAEINNIYYHVNKGDRRAPNKLEELEFHHLPFKLRVCIRHFIVCFNSFLQGMNAREEIYSLGTTSQIIASELDSYLPARQRRKIASHKVSLVFVDRNLDLVSPACNEHDTLMGKIMSLLSRLPMSKIDSAVDLSSLATLHPDSDWTLIPGNFYHSNTPSTKEIFESSIYSSLKETTKIINKKVEDQLPGFNKNSKNSLHIVASERETLENNLGLIQQYLALKEVSEHATVDHLNKIRGFEKMILQSIDDTEEDAPFVQVLRLLKTRQTNKMTLDEILQMFVYAVSLTSEIDNTMEYEFTNHLSQALLQEKNYLSETLQEIVGSEVNEISALETANRIWVTLHSISNSRHHLRNYKHLYGRNSEMEPNSYKKLLSQVIKDCVDPPTNAVTDLEYKSAGLKDIIKTGFSLFVNVSKPKPRDSALLIVYIIGGISAAEVQSIQSIVKAQSSNPSCQVLVGSSHFTYPSDIIKHTFRKNSLLKAYL